MILDLLTTENTKINEHQCRGQKGCGTIDNIIMMRAVIDNNRRLNRKTYCYFADAYKCFDKLWLKDCLVELWRAGMREREVYIFTVSHSSVQQRMGNREKANDLCNPL